MPNVAVHFALKMICMPMHCPKTFITQTTFNFYSKLNRILLRSAYARTPLTGNTLEMITTGTGYYSTFYSNYGVITPCCIDFAVHRLLYNELTATTKIVLLACSSKHISPESTSFSTSQTMWAAMHEQTQPRANSGTSKNCVPEERMFWARCMCWGEYMRVQTYNKKFKPCTVYMQLHISFSHILYLCTVEYI